MGAAEREAYRKARDQILAALDQGLDELNLSGAGLTELPPEIGELTGLVWLNLSMNRLNVLPPEIGGLSKLEALFLGDNSLDALPPEVGGLRALEELYLFRNQLTALPEELFSLPGLSTLNASSNYIDRLTAAVGDAAALTDLSLNGNRLSDLPPSMARLTSLRSLDLGYNEFTHIPDVVFELGDLDHLWLQHAEIRELPPAIAGLRKLRGLFLQANEIRRLPVELAELQELEYLHLDLNRLRRVPAALGGLPRLVELELGDNPELMQPPPEVCNQGTDAVLGYLRDLAEHGEERREAKLLVLGDGNEGKTCLSRALRGLPFEHQNNTKGIDIEQLSLDGRDGQAVTLNIWDFEGQEINHQSHQFFLTRRSLYLVVFKGRSDIRSDRLEYWLDTIRARAPGCKALLVATECEDRNPSVPLDKLRARYPDILPADCYVAVGCENGRNIDVLKRRLAELAAELDLVPQSWPGTLAAAEQRIKARRDVDAPHIDRNELYALFEAAGIDREEFDTTARIFGDMGLITHFPDRPELHDFVVLRPQWLTRAISLVLEHDRLTDSRGEMDLGWLHDLWEPEYPGLFQEFYGCMKEFELCYPLDHRADTALVPLRFSYAKPEIPWTERGGVFERRVEYRFDGHPPPGLVSRLIVKTHHMIARSDERAMGVYWRNGVFLRFGLGPTMAEALCELEPTRGRLRLTVRSVYPQNMIEWLHGFAVAVFRFYRGFLANRMFGCVREDGSACEGFHPEKRVLYALSRGRTLDCEDGWHDVDARALVQGLHSFAEREDPRRIEQDETLRDELRDLRMTTSSMLQRLEGIATELEERGGEAADEVLIQRVEHTLRDWFRLMDERDLNHTPSLFTIVPLNPGALDPRRFFETEYALRFYCEAPDCPHPGSGRWTFRKPHTWWRKTAPALALGLKAFKMFGAPGLDLLPYALTDEDKDAMRLELDLFDKVMGFLPSPSGKFDATPDEADGLEAQRAGRMVRYGLSEDEEEHLRRTARHELNELMRSVDETAYEAGAWGDLTRVLLADDSYRWLCARHAEKLRR